VQPCLQLAQLVSRTALACAGAQWHSCARVEHTTRAPNSQQVYVLDPDAKPQVISVITPTDVLRLLTAER